MNLVQMIASFLGILSTILLAGYYYYLLSNLDVAEQILLPLKEKYYISLIFPLISTFSMVLLGIAIFSSYLQNDAFILYIRKFINYDYILFSINRITSSKTSL